MTTLISHQDKSEYNIYHYCYCCYCFHSPSRSKKEEFKLMITRVLLSNFSINAWYFCTSAWSKPEGKDINWAASFLTCQERSYQTQISLFACSYHFQANKYWTHLKGDQTFCLLFHWNFTPVTVVHYCIRHKCFILLPNVWVVFKIYFAIVYNTTVSLDFTIILLQEIKSLCGESIITIFITKCWHVTV